MRQEHIPYKDITTERLHSIEKEREQTMQDSKFQKWCKQLNIGRMYTSREGIDRANDMMQTYTTPKHGWLDALDII